LAPYRDWLHFHWASGCLKQIDPRSIAIENRVLARYSILQSPQWARLMERLGISSWRGFELHPATAHRLAAQFSQQVSSIYLSPLSEGDARRCLTLANLIGAPFVLHLWDVLEGDLTRGALRELIDRAESVFCVSEPMQRDIAAFRADTALLLFSRDPSPCQASPRQHGPLKVVVHGNISSYADGLDVLDEAIALVERQGLPVKVYFPGSPKILRLSKTTIKPRVKVRGFFATQDDLDRELSHAHVAFLPGPRQPPQSDLRSRYSIPSRTQDYLAVGIPIVGTVHQASATGSFLRSLGLEGTTTCSSAGEVARYLIQLATPDNWATESARSRAAFALLQSQEAPAVTLQRAMARIGSSSPLLNQPSLAQFRPLAVQKIG
jgi:hypothetical protein